MSKKKYIAAFIIGVFFVFGVIFVGVTLFLPVSPDHEEAVIVEVFVGEGLRAISKKLERQNLVRNALVLEIYARLQGYEGNLQAGKYRVSAMLAPVAILQKIVSGNAEISVVRITIPEGWSLAVIADKLDEMKLFSKEVFYNAAKMSTEYRRYDFLRELADGDVLDGYLFPDTYQILQDSAAPVLVHRMLENFAVRLDEALQEDIKAQGRTVHEVITLASIIQAESGTVAEMADVAGVFWKRLLNIIPLESDATVNYALGTSKRQPTFADIKVDHPYNTYIHYGLPPGPIGNPGIHAIRAAVRPAEHSYYFFLHKHDGSIVLSRTFEEHLAAKRRYLD